ncbi:phytanoyl-CoA dioxygenase family protein [Flavobacteriales bacterium]|nr:phytanoyl-CoA dioxygenase family protein [Flavobacteriales bacterium]
MKDSGLIKTELLPSLEDIEFYNQYGWYKSPVIFTDEEIDSAVKGAKDFYDGKVDFSLPTKEGIADDKVDEKLTIRNNEFVTLQKKELRAIGWHPMIRETAKRLTKSSYIRLFADSLVNKLPTNNIDDGIIGWHSDKAYWPTCSSNKLLTVWIPLQDCTIEMGPVVYIDGSHKWEIDEDMKQFFSFNNQDLQSFQVYLHKNKASFKKSFMTLKKGQVSFHSCNTIHSSSPNISNKSRLALAVHLQDDSNHYQEAFMANGEKIIIGYDKICSKDRNGNPDYSDKSIFPII